MSAIVSRHLRNRCQSIALPSLKQGATLSIRSKLLLPPEHGQKLAYSPVHVTIQSSWRDDGRITLDQSFIGNGCTDEIPVQMIVKEEQNSMTSIGRVGSHFSVEIQPILFPASIDPMSKLSSSAPSSATASMSGIISSEPIPTDRVMLDDGTLLSTDEFVHNNTLLGNTTAEQSAANVKTTEYHDGIAHVANEIIGREEVINIAKNDDDKIPGIYLTVHVPEKLNLTCDLRNYHDSYGATDVDPFAGNITVIGKLEGDVRLYTINGDIRVTKIRGHNIELHTGQTLAGNSASNNSAVIYSSNLIEAQNLNITNKNGRFRAKQVHGNVVKIDMLVNENMNSFISEENDDEGSIVDISSLFVSGNGEASIDVSADCSSNVNDDNWLRRRAVRIKSHHGPLQVKTNNLPQPNVVDAITEDPYPIVELGGVNGNCEVNIDNTTSLKTGNEHLNDTWSSCKIHVDSLLPDSVSLVSADKGRITLTLDRKAEADLRILSTSRSECLTEAGALLAEEENPQLLVDVLRHLPSREDKIGTVAQYESKVSISTKAFTKRQNTSFCETGIEYVDGWIENKSNEPDSRFERKIRGDPARGGIGKIRLDGASDQALQNFSGQSNADEHASSTLRALMAVVGTGSISIETVSWLGAIARRYGLDEHDKRETGRTASRRGRPLSDIDENR